MYAITISDLTTVRQAAHCETLLLVMPQKPRVTIVKMDKDGKIVDSLHTLDNRIGGISEIEFVDDYAYLGSPFNTYLARVKLAKKYQ